MRLPDDQSSEQNSDAAGAARPPSPLAFASVIAALTVVAIAVGAGLGAGLGGDANGGRSEAPSKSEGEGSTAPFVANLLDLPPIIANLANPPDAWVRIQATLVMDRAGSGKPDLIAAQIAEDILGFLRTLSLSDIAGASGLQHLREDLNERAMIRSNGRAREIILQSLVVQ